MVGRVPNYSVCKIAFAVIFEWMELLSVLGELGCDIWVTVIIEIVNANIDSTHTFA